VLGRGESTTTAAWPRTRSLDDNEQGNRSRGPATGLRDDDGRDAVLGMPSTTLAAMNSRPSQDRILRNTADGSAESRGQRAGSCPDTGHWVQGTPLPHGEVARTHRRIPEGDMVVATPHCEGL
jgi:hypothetical protein